jgi:hypothetical protein
MFDEFQIRSASLILLCTGEDNLGDWLFEVNEKPAAAGPSRGTHISMKIRPDSPKTRQRVMDQFARPEQDDYGFSRTHVPVALVKYGVEQLVSRSQAKRLLARFEYFSAILLDFRGVDVIGQAFADEVFRVFTNAHPHIKLEIFGAKKEVLRMISHVQSASRQEQSNTKVDNETEDDPGGWSPPGSSNHTASVV